MKKRNKNILFIFAVKVSCNVDETTLNDNKNVQIKKLIKNDNIVKLMKNNNIILLTKNSNTVKLINYNNLMNMTFEFFTYITID